MMFKLTFIATQRNKTIPSNQYYIETVMNHNASIHDSSVHEIYYKVYNINYCHSV